MKNNSLLIIICLIPLISIKKQYLEDFDESKKNINLLLSDTDLETIRENILIKHNYYRKRHQVGDLVRNSDIEKIAQQHSEYLASIGVLKKSRNNYKGYALGENLYICPGCTTVTGIDDSKTWYEVYFLYKYDSPGYSSETDHFTQLVWKDSRDLGCGASCQKSICIITCNYYPAWNYLDQFISNDFPSKEESDEDIDNNKNNHNFADNYNIKNDQSITDYDNDNYDDYKNNIEYSESASSLRFLYIIIIISAFSIFFLICCYLCRRR